MKNALLIALLATTLFSCKKGDTYRCYIRVSDDYTRMMIVDTDKDPLADIEQYIVHLYPGKPYDCSKISRREYKKLQDEYDESVDKKSKGL